MSQTNRVGEIVVGGTIWKLTRWSYDGASLMAEHPDGWNVEINAGGDLEFDSLEEPRYLTVPGLVLRTLIADARDRGLWEE